MDLNNINSKEDFIIFLNSLCKDRENNSEEWENKDLISYLDGICSWISAMDGYYSNMKMDVPNDINWNFIATLFYVGKIYE